MPTIKVVAGTASVELEANEIGVDALCAQALKTLERAHKIEQDANRARGDQGAGGYA